VTARFAVGLSEHAHAGEAVGEAVVQVLDALGSEPDVAVMFLTTPHVPVAGELVSTVRSLLRPAVLVGASAVSVIAGRREVEDRPALVLWAATLDGVAPVRFGPSDVDLAAVPEDAHSLVVVADPFSFPVDTLADVVGEARPGLTLVGGLASASTGIGGQRLVLDGEVFHDGAVGFALSGSVRLSTVVSQGCRPVGVPLIVTASDRNVILELAGKPARQRLTELIGNLSEEERRMASRGLHVGRVVDEHLTEFRRGDFLIRAVLGIDQGTGGVVVGDVVPVGATVQFQVRDATSADDDLRAILGGRVTAPPRSTIVFTCNGRGTNLFDEPDHDAGVVADLLADPVTAGMFCAGEIGPVGARSFVHGFTASIAMFDEEAAPSDDLAEG
jgi:small ligand-binding sensory domain FIST